MKRLSGIRWTIPLALVLLQPISCSRKAKAAFEGSGTLEATEILVSAKAGGTVADLAVREGDTVAQGQTMALIESEKTGLQKEQLVAGLSELRLNIRNAGRAAALARETFEAADRKFNRIRSLRDENSIPQQQFEDAETAFKAAATQRENAETSLEALRAKEDQALVQIELADSQLRDAVVASPISGTVLETFLDRGELARPGAAVASVADLTRMWIKVYIREKELGRIRLNNEAVLRIGSDPNREFKGRVSWISGKAEFTPRMVQTKDARSDLVYAVKVEVPNADGTLKIGMPADVTLNPAGN
jgi:HlyD family secretion protein